MTTWRVKGTYMEACNCQAICPCIVLSPPTEGNCVALIGWHIQEGRKDDVELSGLNVALMAHAVGNMQDGNWKVALYLDERADAAQRDALTAIFSGAEGGHLANLAPLIGEVLGVTAVPIEFEVKEKRMRLKVGALASTEMAGIEGQHGEAVRVTNHPFAPVPEVPFTVMRGDHFRYSDHGISCEIGGRNGFTAGFEYRP